MKPHSDSGQIMVKLLGATVLRVNGNGELEADTGDGIVKFSKPVAYQEVDGKRVEVTVNYVLHADEPVYGFKLERYNRNREVVIDPVLVYSTFLGGSNFSGVDNSLGIAIDSTGNVYVTGTTGSPDFPHGARLFDLPRRQC